MARPELLEAVAHGLIEYTSHLSADTGIQMLENMCVHYVIYNVSAEFGFTAWGE
jgi:hypothetical protein